MSDSEHQMAANFDLEFTYTRSTGPVVGRFLTGLRDRKILGQKGPNGVIVPPTGYDPETSESLDEFVEVGQSGEVTTWAWVHQPREKHPLDHPFAWALILLDGATTPMLHAVDAQQEANMSTGMRVKVRWAAETVGRIQDIACFEPA